MEFLARWRNTFGGILAYPFKILHILGFILINWPLQLSPHVFNWIDVWWLRWPFQNVDFVTKPFLCESWRMLWVIVLLESPPTAKSQPSGRGNQIFSQNCLIFGGIHDAINTNQCPWTSRIKTAPKHDWPTTIFHCGYEVLLLVCICVPTPNTSMLYLTKTSNFCLSWPEHLVSVIMLTMFGKLQALSSVSCDQKRLSSGNLSDEAVVMKVTSDGAFWNLVTPRCQDGDCVTSLTILHSILGGKMQLRPLPTRLSTVLYLLNFVIIALAVLSGIVMASQY